MKMIVVNPQFSEVEVIRNGKSRFYSYSNRVHCLMVLSQNLVQCRGRDSYGNPAQLFVTVKQYDSHGFAL